MKILIIALLVVSSSAHAFNWTRCQSSQPVSAQPRGIFDLSSTIVSNTAVSVTQGISSWGDCSLIGEVEKVRKTFISQNLQYLEQDISKGSGEYLAAYARLHGCTPEGVSKYGRKVKKDYFGIAGKDWETVFVKMEEPFKGLEQLCPLT